MTRQERVKRSAYLETIRSTGTISEKCDTENGKNVWQSTQYNCENGSTMT